MVSNETNKNTGKEHLMNLQESYLKALNPKVSIKISNIDNDVIPMDVLELVHGVVTYKYKTFIDVANGVIYVGKRV